MIASLSSPIEAGRRRLVALITFIYLLLILEGVIRKWLFPSLSQYVFFIRDPFVLFAYWLAFKHGFFPKRSFFLSAGIALAFAGLVLGAIQILSRGGSADTTLLLAGYGWRNYFLYIPFAFVIGTVFERSDIERVVKVTLFLSLPVALLVFAQFMSPLNSPINVGVGEDAASQFRGLTLTKDHTRPMGTFTSDLGQKQFVASCLAMVLALWLAPLARRFVKFWLLLPATGAALACLAFGGSRGGMLHAAILLVAALSCAMIVRRGGVSLRAVLWPSVIAIIAVTLYPIVFPEGYGAFMERWDAAHASESRYFRLGILGRALYGFVDFFSVMGEAPLAGYGLGLAGNAGISLGLLGETGFTGWAETDWARHIVDLGPVLGFVFIVYRIGFVAWLASRCVSGARRAGDPLPVLLLAYVSVELLYGQITGHGSVNGYAWMFTGFCLAAAAAPSKEVAPVNAATTFDPPRRFANLMR
jgi:hypothetical protein